MQADPSLFSRGETEVPALKYINLSVKAQRGRIISEAIEPGDIEALMDALTAKFREYPGMRAFAARGSIITSNDGGTRSINLEISGPDLATIYQVAQLAEARAEEVFDNPRIQSQPSALSLAQPMLQILPRWDRAAELVISADVRG